MSIVSIVPFDLTGQPLTNLAGLNDFIDVVASDHSLETKIGIHFLSH